MTDFRKSQGSLYQQAIQQANEGAKKTPEAVMDTALLQVLCSVVSGLLAQNTGMSDQDLIVKSVSLARRIVGEARCTQ